MDRTPTRRRGRIAHAGFFFARVIAVGMLVVLATMVSSVLQNIPAAQRGTGADTVLLRVEGRPLARGNCPDAQLVADRVTDLATVVGRSVATFYLSPVAGCAADADAYRARVRGAALAVAFAPGDWSTANPDLRQQLVAALAHSLRRFYPAARFSLVVRAGDRVVARAGGG